MVTSFCWPVINGRKNEGLRLLWQWSMGTRARRDVVAGAMVKGKQG